MPIFRFFSIPILWSFFIFILYSISVNDVPESDLLSIDKIAHAMLFIFNTYFWAVALRKQYLYEKWNKYAFQIALIFSLFIGIVLELIQGTIFAGRTTELTDMLANIIGAFLGLIMFRLVYGKKITYRE